VPAGLPRHREVRPGLRRCLDLLYRGSGALAAAFLLAICVIVLAQVGLNLLDEIASWLTGQPIGLVIPSYAEFAGFFLAASSFLALAYTLRAGGHIRVSLVLQHLSARAQRLTELWCIAVAALLAGYFAFFTILLVIDSFSYEDLSVGLVPVPLWIPQSAVALGLMVLTTALVDEFVQVLAGRRASYDAAGELAVME